MKYRFVKVQYPKCDEPPNQPYLILSDSMGFGINCDSVSSIKVGKQKHFLNQIFT